MAHPVIYFEVGSDDDASLVTFYSELFGWSAQTQPGMRYTAVDTRAGAGINGGIGKSATGEPWSTFYVEADDLQDVLDRAHALGAETVVPVTEIPDTVTFAMFNDPDGLLVGLIKSAERQEGDPPSPSPGDGAPVDWFEVLGSDAKRTQAFYRELFGWNLSDSPGYAMVDTGAGKGIQGGIGAGEDARWATVYASVAGVEQTLARAEQLGGKRVYGPHDVDDHMQSGAFRDPSGNVFGVYHHESH